MAKATPAEPNSLTTRPQYGSSPFNEHLTRLESATWRAASWASVSEAAPVTTTCTTRDAPSASAAIMAASWAQASVSAAASACGSDGGPARPLANTNTVSLVDVQPSTVNRLKLVCTAPCSAAF